MKYESVISLGVAAWLAAGLDLRAADPASQNQDLRQIFETALTSRDLEYQKARTAILAHEDAAAFLAEQAQGTNLVSRVIGRAMLTWLRDSAANMRVSERLALVVGSTRTSQIGERAILGRIYVLKTDPVARMLNKIETDVHVLLEVALKGPTFPDEPRYHRNMQSRFTINCYAAGLAGLYDGQDVIPILTLLTDEKEDGLMRKAALCGLRLRKDADLEIFLKGIEDKDQDYRETSYLYLRDMTGQDFGYDTEKYRIWLETNTVNRAALSAK